MQINCNGDVIQVADHHSLSDIIARFEQQQGSMVVAVNQTIIPSSGWHDFTLEDNDVIDIFTLVAGG